MFQHAQKSGECPMVFMSFFAGFRLKNDENS